MLNRYAESPKITERLAAKLMSDIILALNCIHKLKILHLDVKPANLLFESDAPDSHIKLIDFGTTILQKSQSFYSDSVQYMAPELINGIPTVKSDIWSAGVIFYSLMTGDMPFWAENHEGTVHEIVHSHPDFTGAPWEGRSPQAITLIKKMLSKNQKDRPTAEQILSDPWLMAYNRNLLSDEPFDKAVQEEIIKTNVIEI
jgi:calcium-dependent protein kinase